MWGRATFCSKSFLVAQALNSSSAQVLTGSSERLKSSSDRFTMGSPVVLTHEHGCSSGSTSGAAMLCQDIPSCVASLCAHYVRMYHDMHQQHASPLLGSPPRALYPHPNSITPIQLCQFKIKSLFWNHALSRFCVFVVYVALHSYQQVLGLW